MANNTMDIDEFLEYVNTHTAEEAAELLVNMKKGRARSERQNYRTEVRYEPEDERWEEGSPSEEWYNYYGDELD